MDRSDRAIAGFTGLSHGTFHGFELSIPLFVPIWIAEFGVSPTAIGIVVGAGYAIIGLGSPIAGVLADRYGSKRLVLASIAGMAVSFAAVSRAGSIYAIALALIVWGAAGSIYHPAGLSLISRNADRRGTVLAVHGAGGNLGTVLVPLIAIGLLTTVEWRLAIVLLTIPAVIAFLIGAVLRFTDTGRASGDGSRSLGTAFAAVVPDARQLLVGGFAIVLAIQMVYGMYYRGIFTFLPDVLADIPLFEPVSIGDRTVETGQLAYSGLLLVGVFGQYAGGVASDRFDPERMLLTTAVVLVGSTLLFVPASQFGIWPLLAVCALLGFFIYAFAPIAQSLVAEYAPDVAHGLSFGLVYFGTFGVGAVGAAIAGAVLQIGGTPALFATLAGLAVVVSAIAGVLLRRTTG